MGVSKMLLCSIGLSEKLLASDGSSKVERESASFYMLAGVQVL